jgi:type II secretory ATPase GspE/PulE/Tfp pilus assembly ATPase PilB-like protein
VIPILKIDNELTVVVDDPLNTTIINDIETITKSEVKVSLGRTSDILLAIDEIYGSSEDSFQGEQETPPRFISSWFDEEDIQKILNDPSGHALMERILANAFEHSVTRIYFQPGFDICQVSYRVNGVPQEQMQLSREWYSILLFRLKISADFEISEVRRPQYREFSYQAHLPVKETQPSESSVILGASILPTAAGESVVLNVINKPVTHLWEQVQKETVPSLQEKELLDIRKLQANLRNLKSGAFFLGGSPYFDKATTLYTMLNEFDPIRKKIVTLESHSEYRAEKYYQIRYAGGEYLAIDHEISSEQMSDHESFLQDVFGVEDLRQESRPLVMSESETEATYHQASSKYNAQLAARILNPAQRQLSSWLSALQEHDADVLLVDHIANDVVMSQCLDFAARGLLFASLDFMHVFQILTYLLDCQVKPSILTSWVRALMAQQSVRILCQECRQKDTTEIGKQILERFYSAVDEAPPEIYAPGGCPVCNMTGYVYRVILFEVLQMEPWIKDMLLSGASLAAIQHTAEEKDFQSLEKKSLDLLFSGQTSIEEVFSILT